MDNPNYTTEHRKGQHLLNEERYEIEVRLKDGWSIYKKNHTQQLLITTPKQFCKYLGMHLVTQESTLCVN